MSIAICGFSDKSKLFVNSFIEWIPNIISLQQNHFYSIVEIESLIEPINAEKTLGIICLFPEDLFMHDITYKIDCLIKKTNIKFIYTYLINFPVETYPSSIFQLNALHATYENTIKLLDIFNRFSSNYVLEQKKLSYRFKKYWPILEKTINKIDNKYDIHSKSMASMPINILSDNDKNQLETILLKLCNLQDNNKKQSDFKNKNIFIVHGHNHSIKEIVARVIEKTGGNTIILHEQPNKGQTIIEKIEYNSDVFYAVVLLTKDDIGGSKETPKRKYSFRARQNVIFELGYFIAKIGRSNVCCLVEEGVDIPSDYAGICYIPLDIHNYWRYQLIKEIQVAGLPLNLNSI